MRVSIGLRVAAVLAVSVVGATACGSTDDAGPGSVSAGPGESTTISLLAAAYRDGPDGTESVWRGIIADFEKQHPDVDVTLEVQPWANIHEAVRARLQSPDSAPDILNLDSFSGFAAAGMLYEAKDVVSDGVLRDFAPKFAENATWNGEQYALPLFASTRMLFYNQDMFDRVGLSEPPKTWDELLSAAGRISALQGGVSGYGMPLGPEDAVGEASVWTYGAGGSWSDGKDITLDTPQNAAGLDAMKRMIDQRVTQPDPGGTDRTPLIGRFVEGRIGMIEASPPTVAQLAAKNPDLRYGTALSPTRSGDPATAAVADHLMVFRNSAAKHEAARAFLDFFYSPDVYARFVQAEGFVPVTTSGADKLADEPITRIFRPSLDSAKFAPVDDSHWRDAQTELQRKLATLGQ